MLTYLPAGIYLFKVSMETSEQYVKYVSKLTKKTPEWLQCCRSGNFIIKFKETLHIALVFPLLNN